MIKVPLINLYFCVVISFLELLAWNALSLLRFLSSCIKNVIRTSSLRIELIVDLFLLLNLLLRPLYNLFYVLILNLHLSLFILFFQIPVHFLDFHHLLEDEVAMLR